ncbi:sigma-70 family RNA polymerase sigma factor [Virgisporangium aurantiacum]|uniref:RNA polymerase sigma-70 factor, ECF subfamily n=1 Tax=Virgisporangium aurantiacum TaxID=175570 RepID=A0A8J3Z142_9ACTN|nr:sigma-70 family RNA polymerase sigma factor [Virgisporangium aurantiacum]GIJ54412.1 hypothetical protein Vau01_019280 [Virgisporangium aurantiacum]
MKTCWSSDERARSDLDQFLRQRRRLFGIAYRIVGTVEEAEDVVQDVWLRWQRVDRAKVLNAEAFLVTATSRLAINVTRSARRRYETPVAAWPHEEVADHDTDPAVLTERGERIGQAVQLLLERLPPAERAVFVLREGFDLPYPRIARTLRIGAANARQLVRRARVRLATGRRGPIGGAAHRGQHRGQHRRQHRRLHHRLRRAFAVASHSGDLSGLEAVLIADLKRTV